MTISVGALVRDLALPALGYGRVVEARGHGAVAVLYQTEPTPREVRPAEQREIVRARLHAGQRVELVPIGDPGATPREGAVVRALELAPKPKKKRPEDDDEPWDDLVRYEVDLGGQVVVAREDALVPRQAQSDDPRDRLEALSWDEPPAFFARAEMHKAISRWYEESFGIPALLGARIEFLPHQVHAARRVLTDRSPRFVLADEVGLGKTIEAGLIAQALAAARPDLRVLVVAPGSMSRQWLCELFLRFGEQVFVHLDVTRLSTSTEGLVELAGRPRVIASTTALEAFPDLQRALLSQRWDLLVVDEAHQVPPDRPLYGFLRAVAEQAPGVLLLSATPGKRDEVGLRGLLALVAPDVYGGNDRQALARRLAAQEAVAGPLAQAAALLDGAAAGAELSPEDLAALAARWKGAVPHDPVVEELRARLIDGDEDALGELVAYAQEFHRIDRRIVRTRRATVRALGTALCERKLELLRYKPHDAEVAFVAHAETLPDAATLDPVQRGLRGLYLRAASTAPLAILSLLEARRKVIDSKKRRKVAPFDLLAALTSDPGPSDEERLRDRAVDEAAPLPGEAAWLATAIELVRAWMVEGGSTGCARFRSAIRWIKTHLEGGGSKVLVFSQEREVVDELAAALVDELGEGSVATFHHGLEDAALSEAALRFQQPGDCRVLVSDELGGEGRNFQVASAVVHLDQPWSPSRVEQRVGRLDRIGRDPTRPVLSVVLSGPSKLERAVVKLHAEVLKVYERSLGGLELLLPRVQQQVAEAACKNAAAVEALARPVGAAVEEERAHANEVWERALDASRRSLDDAAEQAEVLAGTDGERDSTPLAMWGRRLGIGVKPLGDDVWQIAWSWEHLRRVPAGLAPPGMTPTEGRARRRGTFSRTKALQDEALELFAPGHPLVDALARDALAPTEGRAAVFQRKLGASGRGRVFAVVLGRTDLERDAWQGEEVPAGLVYRAQARLWPQTRPVVVELHPGKSPLASVLADRALQTKLLQPPGDPKDPDVDPEERDAVSALDRDALASRAHLPHLLAALRAGVDLALTALREGRKREAEGAAMGLLEDLRDDLGYLRGVAAREQGPARDEATREISLRERLVESVRRERLQLDAVALVLGA